MTDIIRISLLALFLGTCLAGVLTWFYIFASCVHFHLLARKLKLTGLLRLNPLNTILYPEMLPDEALGVRRGIFMAIGLFIALIAFAVLQYGFAYLICPYVRP